MVVLVRRGVELLLALTLLLVVPAVAAAQDPCSSDSAPDEGLRRPPAGRRDLRLSERAARRAARRAAGDELRPRARRTPGTSTTTARSTTPRARPRRSRWPRAPTASPCGRPTRTAGPREATQTLRTHAVNLRPNGLIYVSPSSPRVGRPVTVSVYGFDTDGTVARIDLDLDGDGVYETQQAGEEDLADDDVRRRRRTHAPRPRRRRPRGDAGGDPDRRGPRAATWRRPCRWTPATRSCASARPSPSAAAAATRTARSSTTRSTSTATGPSRPTTVPTPRGRRASPRPGRKRVGVRATDSDGATATSRRTLEVKAGNDPPAVQLNWMSGRNFSARPPTRRRDHRVRVGPGRRRRLRRPRGPCASLAALHPTSIGDVELGVRVTDDEGETGADRCPCRPRRLPARRAVGLCVPEPAARRDSPCRSSASGANFDIGRREWDLDGDGTFETEGTPAAASRRRSRPPGVHTVRVRITDTRGRSAVGASRIVVAPAAGNLAPYTQISALLGARRAARERQLVGRIDADGSIVALRLGHGRRRRVRRRHGSVTRRRRSLPSASTQSRCGSPTTRARRSPRRAPCSCHAENRPPVIRREPRPRPASTIRCGWRRASAAQLYFGAIGARRPRRLVGMGHRRRRRVRRRQRDAEDRQLRDRRDLPRAPARRRTSAACRAPRACVSRSEPRSTARRRSASTCLRTPRPGTPVSLFASGADADGDTLSYAWDADGDGAFDDGNAQFLQYSLRAGRHLRRQRAGHGRPRRGARRDADAGRRAPAPASRRS